MAVATSPFREQRMAFYKRKKGDFRCIFICAMRLLASKPGTNPELPFCFMFPHGSML
jgi:hypothetical protein